MEIGKIDNYSSSGSINVWILKEVYEKILKKEYRVFLHPYAKVPIEVKDKKDHKIDIV